MRGISFIPNNTNIDFIGKRKITFSVVVLSTILFAIALLVNGLNYGIDFKGGILMDVTMPQETDVAELRQKMHGLNLGDVSIQEFGSSKDLLIKFEAPDNVQSIPEDAVNNIKQILGAGVTYKKVDTVGPKVGGEMIKNAMYAVIFSLIGILIYVAIRFEWRYSLCAVIALAHDCFLIFGLYAVLPLEFNETAITAILMTAGYSINDTIVVLDRIRENIKKLRTISLEEILNRSINETLSRTVLTVLTTLLSLFALFLFGGEVISAFVLPIMITLVIGALSSIFVASPLLLFFNIKFGKALDEEEERIQKALKTEGIYETS